MIAVVLLPERSGEPEVRRQQVNQDEDGQDHPNPSSSCVTDSPNTIDITTTTCWYDATWTREALRSSGSLERRGQHPKQESVPGRVGILEHEVEVMDARR